MFTPGATVARARTLRRRMTPPEVKLWSAIRRQSQGPRFRRQHPLGPYVLDFYCPSVRLAVEVDGAMHWVDGAEQRDARRDAWLLEQGVRTIRLPARLVMGDLNGALRTLTAAM